MKSYKPLIVSFMVPEESTLEVSADAYYRNIADGAASAYVSASGAGEPAVPSVTDSTAEAAAYPAFHFICAPSRPVRIAEGARGASPARNTPGRVRTQPEHRSIPS